ncbi:hypothetical protein HYS92_02965 [Candidatus Daviesbacteria bacterium]|nr:hypothetical protein [Candidatus Daviesbacteria bacterium]
MNWKNNLSLKIILLVLAAALSIFLFLSSILMGMAIYDEYTKYKEDLADRQKEKNELQENIIRKDLLYQEISPLQTKYIIVYGLDNEFLITTKDLISQKEEYIFVGEESKPQWLDDDHIFFTSYCGTACKGVYLIDVRNKEVKLGVLSYVFSDENFWITHFKDWFGKEFQFPGLVEDISTKFDNGVFYLVFQTKDQTGKNIGEKRFLFTGDSLKEQ